VIAAERLASALGASLVLHGAGLAALEHLPRGWQNAEMSSSAVPRGALHATLRAAESTPESARAKREETKTTREKAMQPDGLVPPPAYYPSPLLDERPQIQMHVEPEFPAGAPVASGRVLVHLHIGIDGRVEEVLVTQAEPPGVFEQAAAEAFAVARFTPGKIRGQPVKTSLVIEVLFGVPVPIRDAQR
jgi:TonB family protein